jgi:hypothetical protein
MTNTDWTRNTTIGNATNPGVQDTGTGALAIYEINSAYPGVQRITVRPYAGRGATTRYYVDGQGRRHASPTAASLMTGASIERMLTGRSF